MSKININLRRSLSALTALLFLSAMTGLNLGFMGIGVASAANLTSRKVVDSSSALGSISTDAAGTAVAPGAGGNGAKTNHTFTFTPTTTSIGSFVAQYCTTAFGSCTAPSGMDASTVATIASNSGWTGSPLVLDTTTNLTTAPFTGGANGVTGCTGTGNGRSNCIALTLTTPGTQTAAAHSVGFGQGGGTDWIKNPTTVGDYYVRLYTFDDNAYTNVVDNGNVMFAITTQVNITTKVQETLNFSVQAAAPSSGTPAACTALAGSGNITLGDGNNVLSLTQAYDNHTYFRLATNSANGTIVTYSGQTLRSGSNSIAALSSSGGHAVFGTAGFGIGLDSGDAAHSFSTGLAAIAPYDDADGSIAVSNAGANFAYDTTSVTSPISIANSTGIVGCDTGAVRYVADISPTTAAGIYTTTITYNAIPTY